jgi:YVTN family beta-propeller protein
MNNARLIFLMLFGVLFLTSCGKENPIGKVDSGFLHGAYIANEGAFGNSNGSVSYFDTDSIIMKNHVFESVNGRPLGDVVQCVSIAGGKAFIVVNNSQKVEVVDLKTFESIGVIDSLECPRSFLGINDKKGYLADGNFNGHIFVVDLESLKIKDTIPCGSGPARIVLYDKTALVANAGGWGNDSTLTVIDTESDRVTATWTVGMNPADMVMDKDNQLWILCVGKVVWNPDWTIGEETTSSLVVLDPGSGRLKKTVNIGAIGDFYWPLRIGINAKKDKIYYLEADGLRSININSSNSNAPTIRKNFYGFGIDPVTDLIYGLYVPSFTTSGWMFRYNPEGLVQDSLEVGIGPSQIVFN